MSSTLVVAPPGLGDLQNPYWLRDRPLVSCQRDGFRWHIRLKKFRLERDAAMHKPCLQCSLPPLASAGNHFSCQASGAAALKVLSKQHLHACIVPPTPDLELEQWQQAYVGYQPTGPQSIKWYADDLGVGTMGPSSFSLPSCTSRQRAGGVCLQSALAAPAAFPTFQSIKIDL